MALTGEACSKENLFFWRQGGCQQYAVRDLSYKLVFQDGGLHLFDLQ
jgi:hypothetical protein